MADRLKAKTATLAKIVSYFYCSSAFFSFYSTLVLAEIKKSTVIVGVVVVVYAKDSFTRTVL